MALKEITSHQQMLGLLEEDKKSYVLLYKKGSDVSDCSYAGVDEASKEVEGVNVYAVDVSKARDIHKSDAEAQNIKWIDLVVCNLYPFADTISKPIVILQDALDNIDIGGPTMIRSAAKNKKEELINFYFSEMNESCLDCHSVFATHRFPALSSKGREAGH